MNLEELKKLVARLEQTIGVYSKSFPALDEHNTEVSAQDIPFERKPAQQFLAALGGSADPKTNLSIQLNNVSQPPKVHIDKDVFIKGFGFKHHAKNQEAYPIDMDDALKKGYKLSISKERIQELVDSAKIYVNTQIFSKVTYQKALNLVERNDKSLSEEAGIHWQNLAVGACHAQKIDLLVGTSLGKSKKFSNEKKSTTVIKDAEINAGDPAILLLSSPRLQFNDGLAGALTKPQQIELIEGMFRTLFQATISEKYEYIALPPTGFTNSGGEAKIYFNALMKVAQEEAYKELNIIYHPGSESELFDNLLEENTPGNIVKANKDIIALADHLTREGKLCALHNPSHTDVIYGHYDIGATWKDGKEQGVFHNPFSKNVKRFIFEEFIGSMSTAPLNSRGFNPLAYETVIECFKKDVISVAENEPDISVATTPKSTGGGSASRVNTPKHVEKHEHVHIATEADHQHKGHRANSPEINTVPVQEHIDSTKAHTPERIKTPRTPRGGENNKAATPEITKITGQNHVTDFSKNTIRVPSPDSGAGVGKETTTSKILSPASFFHDDKKVKSCKSPEIKTKSNLSTKQQEDIHETIEKLQSEIISCWAFNKDVKQIKIDALNTLLIEAESKPVAEAIAAVKKAYPRVTEGKFSTRTADLLERLMPKSPIDLKM
ncbi:MAG: hypothetical protein WC627_07635 [Legionella sp.]|jgi:hypothetical protein